ncbi:hypothetical protein AXA84_0387 [Candidatus Phytoplasma oryzae]|nr:hypothetical protein [Candidatus Phytoplasma oryzae]KXT29105.1 hypothetical protein AXA84_0387 [Candidatus Phytoplasma oryzae]
MKDTNLQTILSKKQFPLNFKMIFKVCKENTKNLLTVFCNNWALIYFITAMSIFTYSVIIKPYYKLFLTKPPIFDNFFAKLFEVFYQILLLKTKVADPNEILLISWGISFAMFWLFLFPLSLIIIFARHQQYFKIHERNMSILKYLGISKKNIKRIFSVKEFYHFSMSLLFVILFMCFLEMIMPNFAKRIQYFGTFMVAIQKSIQEQNIKEMFMLFLSIFVPLFIFIFISSIIVLKLHINRWYKKKHIKFIN